MRTSVILLLVVCAYGRVVDAAVVPPGVSIVPSQQTCSSLVACVEVVKGQCSMTCEQSAGSNKPTRLDVHICNVNGNDVYKSCTSDCDPKPPACPTTHPLGCTHVRAQCNLIADQCSVTCGRGTRMEVYNNCPGKPATQLYFCTQSCNLGACPPTTRTCAQLAANSDCRPRDTDAKTGRCNRKCGVGSMIEHWECRPGITVYWINYDCPTDCCCRRCPPGGGGIASKKCDTPVDRSKWPNACPF